MEEREKALSSELAKARCKLYEVESWVLTVAQERLEVYKATKDFYNEKVLHDAGSYLLGKNEVQLKVVLHLPISDLSFVDVELERKMTRGLPPSLKLLSALQPTQILHRSFDHFFFFHDVISFYFYANIFYNGLQPFLKILMIVPFCAYNTLFFAFVFTFFLTPLVPERVYMRERHPEGKN